LKKNISKDRKDVISPGNRLVRAYIYRNRGISPRNMLVRTKFYKDEEIPTKRLSLREMIKTRINILIQK